MRKLKFQPFGHHNQNLQASASRLIKGNTYKDLSTIWVTPTRGMIPAKVVFDSWMGIMLPMNQKFIRLRIENQEVGQAYSDAMELILNNPELAKFKYVLTVEEDNLPPADGILKLYESIEKFDAVGGLYWTKGEGGQPMIYGNPKEMPKNFIPQVPIADAIQECNGLGMGFTLFRMSMLKQFHAICKKQNAPMFKTVQSWQPGKGGEGFTQDLYFFNNAGREGYRFASDNRVKVGHLDPQTGIVW